MRALKDHHPQQQGLRPQDYAKISAIAPTLKDHHPQQQGLRRTPTFVLVKDVSLKDHHPQQQGLRPFQQFCKTTLSRPLKDHHPQQQGLRRAGHAPSSFLGFSKTIIHNNKD